MTDSFAHFLSKLSSTRFSTIEGVFKFLMGDLYVNKIVYLSNNNFVFDNSNNVIIQYSTEHEHYWGHVIISDEMPLIATATILKYDLPNAAVRCYFVPSESSNQPVNLWFSKHLCDIYSVGGKKVGKAILWQTYDKINVSDVEFSYTDERVENVVFSFEPHAFYISDSRMFEPVFWNFVGQKLFLNEDEAIETIENLLNDFIIRLIGYRNADHIRNYMDNQMNIKTKQVTFNVDNVVIKYKVQYSPSFSTTCLVSDIEFYHDNQKIPYDLIDISNYKKDRSFVINPNDKILVFGYPETFGKHVLLDDKGIYYSLVIAGKNAYSVNELGRINLRVAI